LAIWDIIWTHVILGQNQTYAQCIIQSKHVPESGLPTPQTTSPPRTKSLLPSDAELGRCSKSAGMPVANVCQYHYVVAYYTMSISEGCVRILHQEGIIQLFGYLTTKPSLNHLTPKTPTTGSNWSLCKLSRPPLKKKRRTSGALHAPWRLRLRHHPDSHGPMPGHFED
jgi:hypothetical protein